MRTFSLTLAAVVLFGATASLHASPILFENFDELTPMLGVTSVGAFTAIHGTNVDSVGASNGWGFLCAGPASGNCVDLDGTGGNPVGQLRSTMQFSAGTYVLSFDLIGNQRGSGSSASVSFGDYSQTFHLASAEDAAGIVAGQQVTLTSPGFLFFSSNDSPGSQSGAILDNVSVSVADAATTPEPASLLLLGTGLLAGTGFVALRRRRIPAEG